MPVDAERYSDNSLPTAVLLGDKTSTADKDGGYSTLYNVVIGSSEFALKEGEGLKVKGDGAIRKASRITNDY